MSDITFRRTKHQDLQRLLELFGAVTTVMLDRGIQQWDGTYPNNKVLLKDVRHDNSWVAILDNAIVGTYCLDNNQDDQYEQINWTFSSDNVAVMHRVAVDPTVQGKGIGMALCQHLEITARNLGFDIIRLDAYSGNPISNAMYKRLGYFRADGLCYFHNNNIPFYCYEKALSL